ncbi:MAG: aromatic ring-hydroxylating oxygenase subunit alpha [Vicinamibacterales bacterium]
MFIRTAASFQQGARTLPGEYYTSGDIFAAERERIFGRLWNCVGRAHRLAQPGDYVVCTVAGESVIVVRGRDDVIRAFFNVCRHRGTRLCAGEDGRFSDVIQCPYHAWTYAIEGQLIGAPHMHDVEGFDRDSYPLHAAAVAGSDGFVFVNVARTQALFPDWFAPLAERLNRFDLACLERAHHMTYDVRANWKLVFQNYSECLHCPVIHPELTNRVPYQSSANDLVEGPFLGGYMDIAADHESVTMTGRSCAPPISARLNDADRRRAYYYSVMPNLLLSIHPDYVNYYVLTPLEVDRTRVDTEWLFRLDGTSSTINPDDAVSFWDRVNRQDWHVVEQCQLGVSSRRYVPGPYSPRESLAAAWDREYLRLMNDGGERL